MSDDSELVRLGIDQINEFAVPGKFKFIKATVNVDRSPDKFEDLSISVEPENERMTIYLNYRLSGRYSLLEFKDNVATKFFIKDEEGDITPLVYKKYRNYEGGVAENQSFKSQLFDLLKESGINSTQISNLEYTKSSLVKLLKKVNQGDNFSIVEYDNSENRESFNFRLTPGVFLQTFTVFNTFNRRINFSFENKLVPRFAFEIEYVLPFANNKYSIFLEPNYTSFSHEIPANSIGGTEGELTFNSLKLGIGFRYRQPISNDLKVFINLIQEPDLFLGGKLTYPTFDAEVDPENEFLLSGNSISIGFMYHKLGFECRYSFNRNISIYPDFVDQYYSGIHLIAAYNIY